MYQAKTGIPLKGRELAEYEEFCNIGIVLSEEKKSLEDDRIYDENERSVKLNEQRELF